jgi:hypothetical protein
MAAKKILMLIGDFLVRTDQWFAECLSLLSRCPGERQMSRGRGSRLLLTG